MRSVTCTPHPPLWQPSRRRVIIYGRMSSNILRSIQAICHQRMSVRTTCRSAKGSAFCRPKRSAMARRASGSSQKPTAPAPLYCSQTSTETPLQNGTAPPNMVRLCRCPWGRVFRLPLVTTQRAEINKGQTSLPSGAHNKGSAGR